MKVKVIKKYYDTKDKKIYTAASNTILDVTPERYNELKGYVRKVKTSKKENDSKQD